MDSTTSPPDYKASFEDVNSPDYYTSVGLSTTSAKLEINGSSHVISNYTLNHLMSKSIDCDDANYVKFILKNDLMINYKIMFDLLEHYAIKRHKNTQDTEIIQLLTEKMAKFDKDKTIKYAIELSQRLLVVFEPILYFIKEKCIIDQKIIIKTFEYAAKCKKFDIVFAITPFMEYDYSIVGSSSDIKRTMMDNIDYDDIKMMKFIIEHDVPKDNQYISMLDYCINYKSGNIIKYSENIQLLIMKIAKINKSKAIEYAIILSKSATPLFNPILYLIINKYLTDINIIENTVKYAIKLKRHDVFMTAYRFMNEYTVNKILQETSPDILIKILDKSKLIKN